MKAACIGTGGISKVHLQFLKSRQDVQIAALCDVSPENLQRRQTEFGGAGFSDFIEMLDQVKPDAVWLCTPSNVRRDPLLACADRGIPVFCEKPVERDIGRAEEIARELDKRNARVQIGYVFRSMPIVRHLQEEMADDRIHAVQSYYACSMSLQRSSRSWFYDKDLSGGALVDQATHNLDLLRLLMGEVSEVRGMASNPVQPKQKGYTIDEVLALTLLFRNGAIGGHVHTWVGDGWRNEILLSGEKRTYRLSLWRDILTVEEGDRTRTYQQKRMYEPQNEIFLRMVESGDWSRNPCTYQEGLATLKLTLACDSAIGTAGPGVLIPDR